MKPVAASIIAGALTVAGTYARGKTPNMDTAVGVAGMAIGLGLIDSMSPDLAQKFGWLVIVAVALYHAKPLFEAVSGEN